MIKNISISLGNHFENFVERKVEEGKYDDVNDVLKAGLKLLEDEDERIQTLKNAIQEGIDSGISTNFEPKSHLASLKASYKLNE